MPLKIKDLAFVGHPVTDVPRARNFYEQILGLKPQLDVCMEGNKVWIEYEFASGTLAISNMWEPSGKGGATTALEVEEINEAFNYFKSNGVTIVFDIINTPGCHLFGIKDPDGNDLTIHQKKVEKS